MTFAIFKLPGNIPVVKDKLLILRKCLALDSFVNFNIFSEMLFIHGALLLAILDLDNISCISFLVQGDVSQPAFTCSKLTVEILEQRCEICSKLTIKPPERRQWRRFGGFIVNFGHISHLCSSISIVNFEHVIVDWVKMTLRRAHLDNDEKV